MGSALQVVDRPTQGHLFLSRQYVQPQWVLDSANFRVLANAELYAPGKHPPPHLSPFVSYDEDGYVPEYAKAMLKLQVAAHCVLVPSTMCLHYSPLLHALLHLSHCVRYCMLAVSAYVCRPGYSQAHYQWNCTGLHCSILCVVRHGHRDMHS